MVDLDRFINVYRIWAEKVLICTTDDTFRVRTVHISFLTIVYV